MSARLRTCTPRRAALADLHEAMNELEATGHGESAIWHTLSGMEFAARLAHEAMTPEQAAQLDAQIRATMATTISGYLTLAENVPSTVVVRRRLRARGWPL